MEEQLERLRRAPLKAKPRAGSAAPRAAEEFREWWRGELQDPSQAEESLETIQASKELEVSRQEVAALRSELEKAKGAEGASFPDLQSQLREAGEQRARLEEQLKLAREDAGGMRELKATLEDQLQAQRLRLATLRGEYEGKLKLLQDRLDGAERRGAALEADLVRERDLRLAVEKALERQQKHSGDVAGLRAELQAAAEFLEMKIRTVQDQSKGQAHQLRELVEALRRLREQP